MGAAESTVGSGEFDLMGAMGALQSRFRSGDRVTMSGDISSLRTLQEGHGGWCLGMEFFIGKVGIVEGVDITGDVLVKYANHNNQILCLNPKALKKSQEFSIGDSVKIIEGIQRVKEYQEGHGEWNDKMASILGKTAKVMLVLPNDDLLVLMPGGMWRLNPKCCEKVSNSDDSERGTGLGNLLQKLLLENLGTPPLDGFVKDAARGNIQNVREFIKNQRSEIDVKSSNRTALQVASGKGHEDIVLMLLEAGADLEIQDDDGDTALHYSSYRDQPEVMEILLSKGANIKAVNDKHFTALHIAVSSESVKCVRVLLKHSAAVNIQDSNGNTPLHLAIMKENDKIFDMLISDSKIDFTIRNKRGFNALHHAAFNGNNFATERILEKHRDIVDVKKDDGFTALHVAAVNGRKDIIKTLLTVGQAQIDIRCTSQMTPLHLAVRECYMGSIELLISKEADINAKDDDGDTCLHLAVSNRKITPRKDSEILKKVRTQFNLGKDEPDWFVIACYLVFHGGKRYHENHRGKTPLDIIKDESLREKLRNFALKSTSAQPKKDHAAEPQKGKH
ncbi:E3 ubiquitin-protein ligase MIB2-like isoform X3 [Octopus sinensis]|uniref:RING-type E3 ubiquitin transferase n=1 Tax=Octopus sinensis TaxID=2607531 RepID=A0A7E6FPB8_9MOLL|nr:E3 ubiquitin-protein ligase MIB2-like isoform X3 [Octopus sinensis]